MLFRDKREFRDLINITYADILFPLPVNGCLLCHSNMIKIGAFSSLLALQVQAGGKLQAT